VPAVPGVQVEVDPAEMGLDPARLARLDRHFARYVDDGRLPGWSIVVARHGRIVHASSYGAADLEAGVPMAPDTMFRIYSMTKPVTSVAAMMLYEEGAFELKDPVHRYLPVFRDRRVFRSGSPTAPATDPSREPVRVWHLLTHTAGLTYGFMRNHPVDAMYRAAGYEWDAPPGTDLAKMCEDLAALPLLFEPGTEWNYSVATDVLGRLVEVWSGQRLDRFFAERIFEPLGMVDTAFFVPEGQRHRLATLYLPGPGRRAVRAPEDVGRVTAEAPVLLRGGSGLVSTAADYHRFTQLLLHRGLVDGVRLLGPRTVDYMTANHLPGGVDLEAIGRPLFAETTFAGVGFGLGVSVTLDPVQARVLDAPGTYGWGGAASTTFWVDPVNRLTGLFLTQLLPSGTHPIPSQLKQLVYQALAD
jgi:CubicO group peptidase (beta-lactamase class C family)